MRRNLAGLVAAVVIIVGLATILSAVLPAPAFRAQAAAGSLLYEQNCLSCHGGAGGPGVPGKTEPLEGARFASRNPTALEIFDVVRSGREASLRALTDDQLWAAIAAELRANGVDLGDQRLGQANAASAPAAASQQAAGASGFAPPGR